MARHRSPQGRRAHLGPPLFAVPAAAGVGGALRSIPLPPLTSSLPVRFVATAVAGGALAAAGQQALAETIPSAGDGANVLRLGVEELLGTAAPVTALASTPTPASVAPVAAEPVVADATELVKAAELQRLTADAAQRARVVEAARVAEAARVTEAAAVSAGDAVQMLVGRVTSGFGGRWGSFHEGLDIAAPIGTPIHVPLAGTVTDSGPASGFGLWVRVEHEDGTVTVYGHINRSFVTSGQKVTAGEVIAEVGNRGHSTGPHLHIEVVTPGGQKINPRPWLDEHQIGYQPGPPDVR